MPETLDNLALMKETSKCSENLQEYRSGYENPVGEVSGSDLKQISLDLSFTESQDVPYGSQMSKLPNPLSNSVDLNSPLNGVPH